MISVEPEVSSLCLQEAWTDRCPETDQSSPKPPHPIPLKCILILSTYLHLGLVTGLFSSSFPPVSYI
jgi:hypothetical protein